MKTFLRIIEIIAYLVISFVFYNFIEKATDFYQAVFLFAAFALFLMLAGVCSYLYAKHLLFKQKLKSDE